MVTIHPRIRSCNVYSLISCGLLVRLRLPNRQDSIFKMSERCWRRSFSLDGIVFWNIDDPAVGSKLVEQLLPAKKRIDDGR